MQHLIILHTNDIHGRAEGLARVITLVNQIRAENPAKKVFYFDCGDSEDTSNRLSNLTKGQSMHQLLALGKPDAVVVGNGSILRYGYQVLENHAKVVGCPLLLANLLMSDGSLIAGVQATLTLEVGEFKLGLIGLTAPWRFYTSFFGLQQPLPYQVVQGHLHDLQDTDAVIVLSHLGLSDDHALAENLQGQVLAIIGAHSHNLLPEGEWVGDVLIAQAGEHANHLGCIDLTWDGAKLVIEKVSVIPITEGIQSDPRVKAEEAVIEQQVTAYLAEVIGHLAEPLDWSETAECGVANLMADALRHRMKADVGLLVAGGFKDGLPGGALQRGSLWDACDSTGNPGVVLMTGEQLEIVIRNGIDPERAADRPKGLRGRARGYMHLSNAAVRNGIIFVNGEPIDSAKTYRVAGSDFELEAGFGYTLDEWGLEPHYDVPIIIREALVDYLADHSPTTTQLGRLEL